MLTNILLIMSLSGSVILLLYLLVSPIAKRYFSLAKVFFIGMEISHFKDCARFLSDSVSGYLT